jgi:hypothetical protein
MLVEDAPRPAMPGAALDDRNLGVGQQPQHFRGLLPHILGTGMAGEMDCDPALERCHTGGEPLLAGDVDEILTDVEGRGGELSDRGIVGQDQRPLEFEHQGTGRDERNDVVAAVNPSRQRRRDFACCGRDCGDIALFELRHGATTRIGHLGDDPVVRQHRLGCLADARLVVIDEAGCVEYGFASVRGGAAIGGWRGFLRALNEIAPVISRQCRPAVDADRFFHQQAGQAIVAVARPIG